MQARMAGGRRPVRRGRARGVALVAAVAVIVPTVVAGSSAAGQTAPPVVNLSAIDGRVRVTYGCDGEVTGAERTDLAYLYAEYPASSAVAGPFVLHLSWTSTFPDGTFVPFDEMGMLASEFHAASPLQTGVAVGSATATLLPSSDYVVGPRSVATVTVREVVVRPDCPEPPPTTIAPPVAAAPVAAAPAYTG